MDFPEQQRGLFLSLGMSEGPTHPQGFGQHTTAMRGSHLGLRVPFETLPKRYRRWIGVNLGAAREAGLGADWRSGVLFPNGIRDPTDVVRHTD